MQFLLSLGVAVYFVNLVFAKEGACKRNFKTLDEYQRIVNGELVQEGEFPWLVALAQRKTRLSSCGGSILTKLHVLTAGHCFSNPTTKASFIQIVAGTRDYGGFFGKPDHAQVRWGEEMHFHPSYLHYDNLEWVRSGYGSPIDATGYLNHNLLLKEIDEPFDFSDKYVASIPLRRFEGNNWLDQHANTGEISCTVAGWGTTEPGRRIFNVPNRYLGGEKAVIALKVNVTLHPLDKCFKTSAYYNKTTMICASAPCKDSCHGDSGGPFICYFEKNKPPTLTAVVSWGHGCALKTEVGYYARLDNAEPWIRAMFGEELLSYKGVARRVRVGIAAAPSALIVLLNFKTNYT